MVDKHQNHPFTKILSTQNKYFFIMKGEETIPFLTIFALKQCLAIPVRLFRLPCEIKV